MPKTVFEEQQTVRKKKKNLEIIFSVIFISLRTGSALSKGNNNFLKVSIKNEKLSVFFLLVD